MDGIELFFFHVWYFLGLDVLLEFVLLWAADGEIDVGDLVLDGVGFFHVVADALFEVVDFLFDGGLGLLWEGGGILLGC